MLIGIDSHGNIINRDQDNIYQGSNLANEIKVVSEMSANILMKVQFLTPRFTTPEISLDSLGQVATGINLWSGHIPYAVTQYYGMVRGQIKAYIGTTIIASGSIDFEVKKGYEQDFPPEPTPDVYEQIIAELTRISGELINKVDTSFANDGVSQVINNDENGLKLTKGDTTLEVLEDGVTINGEAIETGEGADEKIATHNTSPNAHEDIREMIEDWTENVAKTNVDNNFSVSQSVNGKKLATEEYVENHGGKIDKIKVDGAEQQIVNKEVDLPVYTKAISDSKYATISKVDEIEGEVDIISTDIGEINNAISQEILDRENGDAELNSAIEELQDGLDVATQNIEEALDGVSENAQAIQEIHNDIDQINDDIVDLENAVADVEENTNVEITVSGESGTLSQEDFDKLINAKGVIVNNKDRYYLSQDNTTYRTYLNTKTPLNDEIVHTAIYVQVSPQAVNYRSWSKEEIENNKLDKITTQDETKVYSVSGEVQGSIKVNSTPESGSIPLYDSNGNLKSSTPVNDNDVINKEYVTDNFAPLSFVSNLYGNIHTGNIIRLKDTPPTAGQYNFLSSTSTNTEYNWQSPTIIFERIIEVDTALTKNNSLTFTLKYKTSRDVTISWGARVQYSSNGSTWQDISSNQSFNAVQIKVNEGGTSTDITVFMDLIEGSLKVYKNEYLRVLLFKKAGDSASVTTDIYFGVNVDNAFICSFAQFNFANVNINTEQIVDGSITKEKLSSALQGEIDGKLDKVTSTASVSRVYSVNTSGQQEMLSVGTDDNTSLVNMQKANNTFVRADSTTEQSIANTVMARDNNGRAKVEAPSVAKDIANKDYVDSGLEAKQDVIDSSNKLDADLVDDTSSTNKFVSASEKSTWSGKQDALPTTSTAGKVLKSTATAGVVEWGEGGSVPENMATTNTVQHFTADKYIDDSKHLYFGTAGRGGEIYGSQSLIIKNPYQQSIEMYVGSSKGISISTTFLRPLYNNDMNLGYMSGSTKYFWKNLYLAGNISDGTNSISVANIVAKQDAIPNYLKNASVSGDTLTITKEDDTTVTFSGGGGGTSVTTNGVAQSTWETNTKQDVINSSNKIDADLVSDTNSTNKFVSQAEKEQIATNKEDISTINTTLSGYGNIVTHNTSEFASSSQGAKADTALQPSDVINNTISTDIDKPLSANVGKELNDRITNLAGIGKYLAMWDCTTGLPTTNPTTMPYSYTSGNYYIIKTIASSGGTNYMPNGSSYTGIASSTIYSGSETLQVGDFFYYDGTQWSFLKNEGREGSFAELAGSPYDNSNLASALNGKQATISDLSTIRSGAGAGATALQPNDNVSELVNDAGYLTGITSSQVTNALGYTPYNSTNPNGYTSNTGTVTSVQVQAGTGLTSSQSTAQTGTLNTTISVASGYKLPTTTEWGNKADTSALAGKLDASKCTYQTTAPTSAISDGGVHLVYLTSEPSTKYSGYIYFIAES